MFVNSKKERFQKCLKFIRKRLVRIRYGQIIISICAALLAVWCAYNLFQIFIKYNENETIISLENFRPGTTEFPGITICAPSIFKPQSLAKLFPDTFGKSLHNYRKLRLKQRGNSTFDIEDSQRQLQRYNEIQQYESWAIQNYTAYEIIQNYSVRLEDVIVGCLYVPINIRKLHLFRDAEGMVPKTYRCVDQIPVMESIYEAKKCFTFFSRIPTKKVIVDDGSFMGKRENHTVHKVKPGFNGADRNNSNAEANDTEEFRFEKGGPSLEMYEEMKRASKAMLFDLNPSIEIRLKSIESDIWTSYLDGNTAIVMTVHPPDILQSRRDFLFFNVDRNTFSEITFTKKTTILTENRAANCVTYSRDQKFKTRDNCISQCINMGKSTDCANYYGALSLDTFRQKNYSEKMICPRERQSYPWYLEKRSICERSCQQECIKTIFEVSGQMRNTMLIEPERCSYNWWDKPTGHVMAEASCEGEDDEFDCSETEAEVDSTEKLVASTAGQENAQLSSQFSNTVPDILPLQNINRRVKVVKVSSRANRKRVKRSTDVLTEKANCDSLISIRISPKPWTRMTHHVSITQESFIGTVGGHLGIWLGLSLYKVIKFAVQTAYRLLYKIIRDCSLSFTANRIMHRH